MKFIELTSKKKYNPERVVINDLRFYTETNTVEGELTKISPSINTLLSFVSDTKENISAQVDNYLNNKYSKYENLETLKNAQKKYWTVRGDIVHKCMEDSIQNQKIVSDWIKSEDYLDLFYTMANLEEKQHIPEELSSDNLTKGVQIIFDNFIKSFVKFKDVLWCLSETQMWSENFAGTVDAGYWESDQTVTILDLKTTSKNRKYNTRYHNHKLIDYILQMLAYSRMVEEMYEVKCKHLHLFSVNPYDVEEVKISTDSMIMNKKYQGMSYNNLLDYKIEKFKKEFSLV